MNLTLIQVPYDSGAYNRRMGKGPFHLVEHGVMDRASAFCDGVEHIVIEAGDDFPMEVGTTFRLLRATAEAVRRAVERGAFPLILAGNCSTTVGALSGLVPRDAGLIWFDAHGDFHTPETTPSGFLDGMALSIAVGHCWQTVAGSIPGYRPIPEERVVLVGARDFEPLEAQRLEASRIIHLPCSVLRHGVSDALDEAIATLAAEVDSVFLHIDLDVHDAALAPANRYKPPGGLTPDKVREMIITISGQFSICGATLAAYDPGVDDQQKGLQAARGIVELLCALVAAQRGGAGDPYLTSKLTQYDQWLEAGEISYSARVIPVSESLDPQQWVLPSEQAMGILRAAESVAVQSCECRSHYQRCDHPLDVCLLLNEIGDRAVARGEARHVSLDEAAEILVEARQSGLVHLSLYMPNHQIFALCSCCSCCCHDLQLIRLLGRDELLVRSEYVAATADELCTDCGVCAERCMFDARTYDGDRLRYQPEDCVGCGLCVTACPVEAISMVLRGREETASKAQVYEITVKGIIGEEWSSWFDGLAVVPQAEGRTSLLGPIVDQAALYGLLNKIHSLGLCLLSVRRVENKPRSGETSEQE